MSWNISSKLTLDKNWLLIIKANDDSIQSKLINISWKTFNFFDVENNWTIFLKWNKDFQIWQLKNVQSKNCLIRFINFDFEEEYQNILNWKIKFDLDYFEAWLSIFQDLSEDESEILPFIYKLKKHEEKYVEELLNLAYLWNENRKVNIWTKWNLKFKFFQSVLDENWKSHLIEKYTYQVIEAMIDSSIQNHDIQKLLSFLMWIYVNWFIKVDYSNWIVFQIPLLKSLFLHKTIIYKIFSYLQKYFSLSESKWSIFQSASSDWDFEEMFNIFLSKVFKNSSQYSNWTSKTYPADTKFCFWWLYTDNKKCFYKKILSESMKERLFNFFNEIDWLENWIIFINKVEHAHIKFLKK